MSSAESAERFRRLYARRSQARRRRRRHRHRSDVPFVRFWANALPVLAGNLATAGALAARGTWARKC